MKLMVWHYTTGEKHELIMKDGLLKRTDIGIDEGELPILWFSSHQHFEPSAQKACLGPNGYARMSIEMMQEYGGGLYRYGVPVEHPKLFAWLKLRPAAKMSASVARRLEKRAIAWKAKPMNWFGFLEDMPIGALAIERMTENQTWKPI